MPELKLASGQPSPILDRQADILRQVIDQALETHSPGGWAIRSEIDALRRRLDEHRTYVRDAAVVEALRDKVGSMLGDGPIEPAVVWGRVAYIADRQAYRCWLNALNIVITAGILTSAVVETGDDQNQIIGTRRPIPPRIIQYWDKPVPPPDVMSVIESWRLAKAYAHRLIDDSEVRAFLEESFDARILRAYDSTTHAAGKAGLFLLAWLWAHGGIYADVDEHLVGVLDALLPPGSDLVLTWAQGPRANPCVQNSFIAAVPRHRFIENALWMAVDRIETSVANGVRLNAWAQTGPGVVTATLLDDWAFHGTIVDAPKLALFTDPEARKILSEDGRLQYKATAQGNWRMEVDTVDGRGHSRTARTAS